MANGTMIKHGTFWQYAMGITAVSADSLKFVRLPALIERNWFGLIFAKAWSWKYGWCNAFVVTAWCAKETCGIAWIPIPSAFLRSLVEYLHASEHDDTWSWFRRMDPPALSLPVDLIELHDHDHRFANQTIYGKMINRFPWSSFLMRFTQNRMEKVRLFYRSMIMMRYRALFLSFYVIVIRAAFRSFG